MLGWLYIMIEKTYIEEEIFEGFTYRLNTKFYENYEYCTFKNCDFTEANLTGIKFLECEFHTCNLSNAKLLNVAFRDVRFVDSKILGAKFDDCINLLFSASFDSCKVDHSSFYGLDIQKTVFYNSSLREVNFGNCNLQKASFNGCDLAGALFSNTHLEGADLEGAVNYCIDPTANRIKKARFALPDVIGLLQHFDIKIL